MSSQPVIIERVYNVPVETVWKAISNCEDMKQWYFNISEFRPEPGFEFEFTGQGSKGEEYLHRCKVTEAEPRRKLSYSWSYRGIEGVSYVTFELFEEGEKTRLKLTHTGLDSFKTDSPDFKPSSFNDGWTYILGTSLKDYLEKK